MSSGRIAAVMRKEFREFRRSRAIIGTMGVLPLVFLVEPMIVIFRLAPTVSAGAVDKAVGTTFLLLLLAPALLPAAIAAYSVIGEREQGTLEPLLTTPVRREEILLGKALATIVPTVGIAYIVFVLIEVGARLFATNTAVSPALLQGPHVLAEILFAPLLAGWSIWVGIAISARSSDVRVAQQLGTLAGLPPLGVVALISYNVIAPSVTLAVVFALVLLAADVALWRVVSAMFDRERLITGATAPKPARAPGPGARRV